MGKVALVRKDALEFPPPAPGEGIARATAFEKEGVWVGRARVPAHSDTGWHHHGEHDTYVHVIAGQGRVEAGPGGKDMVEIVPGDIALIPAGTVHRELTGSADMEALVVRVGRGGLVFPVPGPE